MFWVYDTIFSDAEGDADKNNGKSHQWTQTEATKEGQNGGFVYIFNTILSLPSSEAI